MPDVAAPVLHRLSCELLCAIGANPESARIVADSLINANLAGHDSHGVLRLPAYLNGARLGHMNPTTTPKLLSVSGATAIVDAEDGSGPPVGTSCSSDPEQPAANARTKTTVEKPAVAVVRNLVIVHLPSGTDVRWAPGVDTVERSSRIAPYGQDRVLASSPQSRRAARPYTRRVAGS